MKIKNLVIIAIILSISVLTCCTTTQGLSYKQNNISSGQSKNDVMNILGMPGNKQFNGKNEAWQYCSTGLFTDNYVVVWFYDGTVTGMTTYSQSYGNGNCNKFFKSINWNDAPDKIIEIRNK